MRSEIPQMLKQGGGAIVNTASVAGLVGLEGSAAYNASKHGVIGLTKTAALEYTQKISRELRLPRADQHSDDRADHRRGRWTRMT